MAGISDIIEKFLKEMLDNSENGIIINSKELINLETEFLKTGVSVYDGLYLPGKWSTEGQDTKITSYEDIQKYYNGKLVSE